MGLPRPLPPSGLWFDNTMPAVTMERPPGLEADAACYNVVASGDARSPISSAEEESSRAMLGMLGTQARVWNEMFVLGQELWETPVRTSQARLL